LNSETRESAEIKDFIIKRTIEQLLTACSNGPVKLSMRTVYADKYFEVAVAMLETGKYGVKVFKRGDDVVVIEKSF